MIDPGQLDNVIHVYIRIDVDWLVGWLWYNVTFSGISAIYSDGTGVKFPNLDLLPGTQRHGKLGGL